ncbi:SIR2 family protein [uncultured Vagococcus sp.]|uniref:SIR2 family NAD-dependent protein deacylase n=1 Tax=uncultured Vagococcus sp. TaxID=189676 RepID=UPI00258E150A|nr:SIR2 family protein [uncultured Vagococcus sp.]
MVDNNLMINEIINAMNDDSLIVFVGAGVSANSGLPTWNQLIDELRLDLGIDLEKEDNLKVAQFYYDTWGEQKYFQKISDIFQEYINAPTNEIHDEIFKIQPRHIITTNYDTLIERKIDESIIKYSVIRSDLDIPYTQANRFLIKMHGDLDIKNIVLKENDYLDYQVDFPMISTLIKSLIMNNTILFIGYSLGDTTFNSIFRLIHNTFGESAKKSYFYTPSKPNEVVKEYYKKKGLHVLSSEQEDIPNNKLGEYTSEFLSNISKRNQNRKVTNHEELWKNIKFLDKFNFIEPRDFVKFLNLEKKAFLYYPDSYRYEMNSKEPKFDLPEDSNTAKFLKEKTDINYFLGNEIKRESFFRSNSVLLPGFQMYKNNKPNEAKRIFREIANKSYKQQDYLNYMLAEFNINSIPDDIFSEEKELVKSVVNIELRDAIEKIIENSKNDTKKLAIFFRDTIFNFNFIYKKLFKVNDFLDRLKSEHYSVKKGGRLYNNNFSILRYEVYSFNNFIEKNCICIGQYKEYQMIINRYFESLIIAFDNSNNIEQHTGEASSFIEKLDKNDIRLIIPHIDLKLLPIYLNNYSIGKIRITNEAFNYIMDESLELCKNVQYHYDRNLSLLKRYIVFLSYVDLDELEYKKIIQLFDQYPVYYNNRDEIKLILNMIILKIDKFNKEERNGIVDNIAVHLKTIVLKKEQTLYNIFSFYRNTLKELESFDESLTLNVDEVFEKFIIIDSKLEKCKNIEEYKDFISNFYYYFEKDDKELVDKILIHYSKLPSTEKDYFFIIELIESGIDLFNDIKDEVLSNIINRINYEQPEDTKSFPDPLEMAVADLFNLIQFGYFNIEDIKNKHIEEKIKDKIALVDWVLFDLRTDEVIEKLMKYMTFSKIKEDLCETDEDKMVLDSWAIKQFEQEKLKNYR